MNPPPPANDDGGDSQARRFDTSRPVDRTNLPTGVPDIRNINVFLSSADHKKLRKHALELDRSLQSVVITALSEYSEKNGLGAIALVKAYRK